LAIAVNDVFQVKVYTYCVDQIGVNIVHYQCVATTGNNSISLASVAATMDTRFSVNYKPLLSAQAEYIGCGVSRIDPSPTPEVINRGGAGFGSVIGDVMSRQTCGIITKRTDMIGRRKRGRFYVSFPGEADNSVQGVPTPAYITRLTTLADVMDDTQFLSSVTPVGTADLVPVVRSQVPLITYERITSCIPRPKWGTQRSRGSYGAVNARP
jgi:hypothetical protein